MKFNVSFVCIHFANLHSPCCSKTSAKSEIYLECPICAKKFPESKITDHGRRCAAEKFDQILVVEECGETLDDTVPYMESIETDENGIKISLKESLSLLVEKQKSNPQSIFKCRRSHHLSST